MKTKILTEKSRFTQVEAIARNGEFEYQATYVHIGKDLSRVQCNIYKVEVVEGVENMTSVGYMLFENGSKSMNFTADVEITPHIVSFEGILKEVKEEIGKLPIVG